MSQFVLGGMEKGHELIQQLLCRAIGSRTLSLVHTQSQAVRSYDVHHGQLKSASLPLGGRWVA